MRHVPFLSFVSVVFLFPVCAPAQTATGSIAGSVRDPANAAVAGAKITVVNTATNESRSVSSNELGYYSFPLLPPATYRLEAEMTGFKRFIRENIKLDVALAATIDVSLALGAASESVTVTAEAPLLESGSASLGHVIETNQLLELPLSGRNAYSFATLVPGVRASGGFTQVAYGMYNDQFVSINGSRPNQNQFYMDGGTNTTAGFNGPGVFPSVDMVQEYKVQTNNFSAEFSNTSGGVINVVTKSGTNRFHGGIYEFLRNDKLDANDFFVNRAGGKKAPFRFNQFGGTVGGPVIKDHTFFFFAYEGLRWTRGFTAAGSLPTEVQRAGDFSQTRNQAGALITIYDPLTSRPDPARAGRYIRTPFTGNIVPQDRIDPVARALVKLTPPPNTAGNPITNTNNFVSNFSAPINKDLFSIRVDHAITSNQKIYLRYSANDTNVIRPHIYGEQYYVSTPTSGDDGYLQRQVTLDYTYVISPTLILELNSSFLRYYLSRETPGLNYDPVQLGFPAYYRNLQPQLLPCFPGIGVTGMGVSINVTDVGGGFLGSCGSLGNSFDTFGDSGNLTKVMGSHTLKTGFSYGVSRWSARNFFVANHSYSFGPAFTQGPDPLVASGTAGYGYASFLLGNGSGSMHSDGPGQNLQTTTWGVYFQDDWKVTPKLTLNLGLRYDNPRPWTERFNRVTGWCWSCTAEAGGVSVTGGLAFPGVNGRSRYLYNPDNNNFAPRFGFAWAMNPQTTFRGGFGLFYGPVQGGAVNNNSTPRSGFDANTNWVSTIDSITPVNPLSNPFPSGFEKAPGSAPGLLSMLGQSVAVMDPNRVTPYSEQWNLDVQRTLPGNFLFDLAYAGSRGLHLFGVLQFNQLPDQYLSMGDTLRQLVSNPYYGLVRTGTLSAAQVQRGQLLRPYPQFTAVTGGNASYGASTYHSLQVKIERRFSRGFSVMASYTFSKLLDDVISSTAGGGFPGEDFGDATLQNFNNRRLERAPAQFDAPHWLSTNWVWELPFGSNKRYLSGNKWLGSIVGGWQANGIATFRSGAPLALRTSANTLGNYGGAQRPNWNGEDPTLPGSISSRVGRYFNTAAFSTPDPYSYGNVARLVPWLRAPGLANLDLALSRNIPFKERYRLQFRFETFNTLNHPQFGLPNMNIGAPAAGVISTQVNLPRDMQFALKLQF